MAELTDSQRDALVDVGLLAPDGPHADERAEMLAYLIEHGATVDDLVAGEAEDRLHAAAGDRMLRKGEDRTSLQGLEKLSGVPVERLVGFWRAAGFAEPEPDALLWGQADAELFEVIDSGAGFLGEEIVTQFTRVIGSSMARIADAAVALFLSNVEGPIVAAPSRPVDLAKAVTEAMFLVDQLPVTFDVLFRHHLEVAIRRAMGSWRGAMGTALHAVGFVDLVGSTGLLNQLDAGRLSSVMTEFEQTAADLASGHGSRVVKAIGDEIMFYTVDPRTACLIASELIDAVEMNEALGSARAGVSVGPVVWQDGDCYGAVVNLASRLVDVAEPGEVLVDGSMVDALGTSESVELTPRGERRLKGFEDPVAVYGVDRRSGR